MQSYSAIKRNELLTYIKEVYRKKLRHRYMHPSLPNREIRADVIWVRRWEGLTAWNMGKVSGIMEKFCILIRVLAKMVYKSFETP